MRDFQFFLEMSTRDLLEDQAFRRWAISPTNEEIKIWDKVKSEQADNKIGQILDAIAIVQASDSYFNNDQKDDAYIADRLNSILDEQAIRDTDTAKRFSKRKLIAIILVVCFLCGLALLYFTQPKAIENTHKTQFAEWKKIELPDASTVEMNANSELTIMDDWSKQSVRKVWLKGEAYFDVKKEKKKNTTFQVIADEVVIEVLGTEFNVHNRDDNTEIFLKEGKIKLMIGNREEYLNEGDFISYSKIEKRIVTRKNIPQEPYSSWKKGTLQITGTVEDIFKEIEQIYGVSFQTADVAVLKEERKVAIPMRELDTVLPILEAVLNITIVKDGRKLIIK